MIRISQIKMSPVLRDEEAELKKKAAGLLRVNPDDFQAFSIVRKSLDARKKPEIYAVYTVDVKVEGQERILERLHGRSGQIQAVEEKTYQFPVPGTAVRKRGKAGGAVSEKPCMKELLSCDRPIIVGTGPAGLFCGYMLAKAGFKPLLLERGKEVHKRREDVERFWREGVLNPDSNVQFGEGGAGTFSDGKLTTTVKDPKGRMREVLRIFVEAGAPKEILYDAKPHIGTDILLHVIENLRRQIMEWGGEVRFESQVTGLLTAGAFGKNRQVVGVTVNGEDLRGGAVILAIGHSARDTFQMLHELQVPMEAKAFAVGLRMEHPREMIDRLQYGECGISLPAASYKVTAQTASGRGVYSFCMCPGGYVVNASSESGRTAVNGMSYSGRDGANSNSAMIVTVSPADYEPYGGTGPLAGIAFQRHLEERAYEIGRGAVPVERYGDFRGAVLAGADAEKLIRTEEGRFSGMPAQKENKMLGAEYPGFAPAIKGAWTFAPVHEILPDFLNQALAEGIDLIGQKMSGFADGDAYLSGVESRTSSPVRILRDETGQSALKGLFPCGEGAGYAGGITSAAMDGILIAEKVAAAYRSVVE